MHNCYYQESEVKPNCIIVLTLCSFVVYFGVAGFMSPFHICSFSDEIQSSWCGTGGRSPGLRGFPPAVAPLNYSSESSVLWRCRTPPCTSPQRSAHDPPRCWTSRRSPAVWPSTRCSCANMHTVSGGSWQQRRPKLKVTARCPLRGTMSASLCIPRHPLFYQMICFLWTTKAPGSPSSSATVTLKVTFISELWLQDCLTSASDKGCLYLANSGDDISPSLSLLRSY